MTLQCRSVRDTPEWHRCVRHAFAWLAPLAAMLAVTALCAACSAQATMGTAPSSGGAASGSPDTNADSGARAATAGGADWAHTLQVVANLSATQPAEPLVVLLGGSAARESTISDDSWGRQIKGKGGPSVAAYNLGSRGRTMAQNVALIKALPEALPDVPTIVYIGVNLGSFTSAQKTARISLPAATTPLPAYKQHAYSDKRILSAAKKRSLVTGWRVKRYPVFTRNFKSSAGVLEKLIETCREQGFHPVLFDLPRNTAIIGHRLDKPIARYRTKCKALAKKHDVPYVVDLVSAAKLRNQAFYDLWHLVEPGRKVWQGLLSAKTVKLLDKYSYDTGD